MPNQQNIVTLNKLCFLANKSEKRAIRCRKCNNEEKKLPQKGVYMYVDIPSNKIQRFCMNMFALLYG